MSSVTVKVIILFVTSKAKDRRYVNFESLKEPYHDEYKGNQPLNCFTVLTNVVNIRLFRTLIFGTVGIRCVKARQRRTCPLAWLFPRALSVSATNHKKRTVYVIFISVRTDHVHLSCLS